MEISAVISGVSSPFLFDCLNSMKNPPHQIIAAIDRVAQTLLPPDQKIRCDLTETEVRTKFPSVQIVENNNFENWNTINQTYNTGLRHVTNKYAMILHDDVLFDPNFDYTTTFCNAIDYIESNNGVIQGKKVVGLVYQTYEKPIDAITCNIPPQVALVKEGSATGSIYSMDFIKEIGWLDEEYGVWFDVHLNEEVHRRDYWTLYVPVPPLTHLMSGTLKMTNWIGGWSASPKWATFSQNFVNKYGRTHEEAQGSRGRVGGIPYIIPLDVTF